MVQAAERRLGVRPQRRPDLLCQRIQAIENRCIQLNRHIHKTEQAIADVLVEQQQNELPDQQQHGHRQIRRLKIRLLRYQAQLADRRAEIASLQPHLIQLEHDNATLSAPIQVEFRLDAGFGTRENVAWLIEMGYEVYTKPYTSWLKSRLQQRINAKTAWVRVGKNATMTAWSAVRLDDFPYPLDLALEHFQTKDGLRASVLLHFGPTPVTADLTNWFTHYNRRQIIEAGIKEGKQVFQMHHLKVRSEAALYLQEHFATFAANLVRWAAVWLLQQQANVPAAWQDSAHLPVKSLVVAGAHTSAFVIWFDSGCQLIFTDHSIFAGLSIAIQRQWAYQLPLPFFQAFYSSA
jgi:hypothetical protein